MVFGEYKYLNVKITDLCELPQVRKKENVKFKELIDSIRDKGLINPLDIALMNEDNFKNHIDFLNKLWQANINYQSYPNINGTYYVIISGHTRLEAIKQIAKEDNQNYLVSVKVHPIKTSEEILALQLDENIHSEPRIEERAIAIIEYFKLGIENKLWQDKTEFINKNKDKFSKQILYDALSFSNLPLNVQQYIFNGNIYYAAGVELGKMHPLIIKYVEHLLGDKATDEELIKSINYEYAIILGKLQKNKSVKSSLSFLSGYKKMIENVFKDSDIVQEEMQLWFNDGVNRQTKMAQRALEKEHKKLLEELTKTKLNNSKTFLELDEKLTGEDHTTKKKLLEQLSTIKY